MPESQTLSIILARADNGVIGRDNALPWRVPADLKRFKSLTMGASMIMGRKTFESFPNPLPGRRHIVLTRDRGWHATGAEVAHSPGEALHLAGPGLVWVIGGADIFALYMDRADRVELTEIHAQPSGDTFFGQFDQWREIARDDYPAQAGDPAYSFVTLAR